MKTSNVTGTQPNQNPYQNTFNNIKDKADQTLKQDFMQPIDTFTKSLEHAADPSELR